MIKMYRKLDRKSPFTYAATWWSSTSESSEYATFGTVAEKKDMPLFKSNIIMFSCAIPKYGHEIIKSYLIEDMAQLNIMCGVKVITCVEIQVCYTFNC